MPKVCFSTTAFIPKSNGRNKTSNQLSTLEACKIIGIDHRTYFRQEGRLFPNAQRDPENGYRIFTKQEVNKLKTLWENRKEYYSQNRHYHYHKTGRFYSLTEVCKEIGISTTTYINYEGKIFPLAQRDHAGRRLFTEKDIEQIKEIWDNHEKRK